MITGDGEYAASLGQPKTLVAVSRQQPRPRHYRLQMAGALQIVMAGKASAMAN